MVIVHKERCIGCGACAQTCLSGTIAMGADGKAFFDPSVECISCGHCVSVCPCSAVEDADPALQKANAKVTRKYEFDLTPFLTEKRSIRNYERRPVEKELIAAGLEVAQHAPCSANGHKVHWVIVYGFEKVAALYDLCKEEFGRLGLFPKVKLVDGRGKNIVTFNAPAMMFVYADDGASVPGADSVIAMLYADLYWRNKGMGTCWSAYAIKAANQSDRVREFLGIPEGKQVYGAVSLGYPAEAEHRLIPGRRPAVADWIE